MICNKRTGISICSGEYFEITRLQGWAAAIRKKRNCRKKGSSLQDIAAI
ncbi:hypothetical protein HMPREF0080_00984 [Anaeroglobus geminatus F0357]|uniref:Uncharacterized protein n=1 Tax=Anaeroglobus geminatus F0357 TaxID=861450 RepID=G9YH57_9FIRM|nr:hypothetical protein HMPREF0080_00984 [Anaeroglobus geminatus F0357]